MQTHVYEVESRIEQTHWWFVGRRNLFRRQIEKLNLSRKASILDIGSSTGTNLRLLKSLGFSNYKGLDLSPLSKQFCAEKGLGEVILGDIIQYDFGRQKFDLILATDVLEHLDDDQGALEKIFDILSPGGFALVTVPTFEILWGLQDEVSHHRRRYRLKPLLAQFQQAGFQVRSQFYFNFSLFMPILLARQIISFFDLKLHSENQVNSCVTNLLLKAMFSFDLALAPYLRVPFGVSAFVLVQKPLGAKVESECEPVLAAALR